MISKYDQLLSNIKSHPKANIFTTRDFLDISNRVAVDKALSMLVKNGVLRRLAWGLYDCPIRHPKLGVLPPDLNQIVDAIQRQSGDTLQIDGAKAANILGLSTQVPAKIVYLTNGHSRDVVIGNWTIKLKHASPKILAGAGQMAGCVLQALRYLGKYNINASITSKISAALSKKDKQQLKKLIPYAPSWAYNTLHTITEGVQ